MSESLTGSTSPQLGDPEPAVTSSTRTADRIVAPDGHSSLHLGNDQTVLVYHNGVLVRKI